MPSAQVQTLNLLLGARFSCRGYLPQPVERHTIETIVAMAQRVPSWCNSQPWMVHLLSAEAREQLSGQLIQAAHARSGKPDIPFPARYSGIYKNRRSVCGWQLYEAVGVTKGDRAGSVAQMMENYRFFGAPHVAIISTPKELGPYGVLDCGAFITAFTLAAQAHGVSSIPQAAVAEMSEQVRDIINLPEDRDVLCAISFGYQDPNHPANGFRTQRAPVSEVLIDVDASSLVP